MNFDQERTPFGANGADVGEELLQSAEKPIATAIV